MSVRLYKELVERATHFYHVGELAKGYCIVVERCSCAKGADKIQVLYEAGNRALQETR